MPGDRDPIMSNNTASQLLYRVVPTSPVSWVAVGAALAASLLLSGCTAKPEAEEAPTVTVQVAGAVSQPIQLKVTADAVIYPLDQAAIVPKVASPVRKFYVNRGSP